MPREPQTPEQWQAAVDSAHALLAVHSARCYGLIETDMKIDVERCEALLKRGHGLGYTPAADAVERFIKELQDA